MALSTEKQAFYARYAPMAIEQQQRYGIPASVTLAQMYLESGCGKSRLAREGNNYFGIKCPPGWVASGKPYSLHNDDKPNEKFCNYSSVADSMTHHSQFLKGDRYAKCRQLSSSDYAGWCKGLQEAGYATDKHYAETLIKEIKAYHLDQYDRQGIAKSGVSQSPVSLSATRGTAPTGNYSMPLEGSELVVTSGFGHRHSPIKGASSDHKGIDLRAKNVPILATEDNGKVYAVGSDSKSGNYVIVEYPRADGSKVLVSYAHLSNVSVHKNEPVSAGQQLGVSGASGLKGMAPHLHFRVRVFDGESAFTDIDPTRYLAEISLVGNLETKVVKKGDTQKTDLLLAYQSSMDKDVLAQSYGLPDEGVSEASAGTDLASSEARAPEEGLDGEEGLDADEMRKLIESGNLSDLFKYMAYQNGDKALGGSGDILADLVSMLFSGLMAFSALINDGEDLALSQEGGVSEGEQQGQAQREESVDVNKARMMASMNFDMEYPAQREQQQNLRRI